MYPTRCNVTQFILSENYSTCFGWYHHPSSGAQTTVSTAPGICHTVTAICRYRGRVGIGLSVLWVAFANILICIQPDATLHSLFYLETALHVSGGTITHHQENKKTVSTAPGICHTVTTICRYRGRVGTGLSVLWVAFATHSTLKPVPSLPR